MCWGKDLKPSDYIHLATPVKNVKVYNALLKFFDVRAASSVVFLHTEFD